MISAVRKLMVLSENCSFWILAEYIAKTQHRPKLGTIRFASISYVSGATSLRKTNDHSCFRSPDIGRLLQMDMVPAVPNCRISCGYK